MTTVMRGRYSRPEHFSRFDVGFMRSGGHIGGVSIGVGRRGWYLGVLRATPCWHERRCDELQRRVDRTIDYFDELLDGPLDATTRTVVEAARRSLISRTAAT